MQLEPSAHLDSFARDRLPPPALWPEMRFDLLERLEHYPKRLNCAVEFIDKQAARFGTRPAMLAENIHWTYDELRAKVDQLAHVLVDDFKVKPGDRVLLRAYNHPFYVACWFAVMKVGAIAVATMPLLRAKELGFMLDRARVTLSLCDWRLRDELEAAGADQVGYFNGDPSGGLEQMMAAKPDCFVAVDTAADDVCLIAFTSGTTGNPKGCLHFHRDMLAICDTFGAEILRAGPGDVFTGSPPIAFTFGLGALVLFPLHAGAASLLVEQFTPEKMLAAVQSRQVSVLFTAPTAYRAMLAAVPNYDLTSLKTCVSAGEALPRATWEAWEQATGLRIIDGIGSTELLHIFIASHGPDLRPGSTGKPIPGFEARVVDRAGEPVPDGTPGRLQVRGPTGCRYLDDAERQTRYVENGWNTTGDIYIRDADGYYWYQARSDDMIVSAGYNIAGPEVESTLLTHPAVLECAVVGAPDPERGEIVKAFVVVRPPAVASPALAGELQDFVKRTIAPYKYPRAIAFVDALPKTQTGKLQRFLLRQAERATLTS